MVDTHAWNGWLVWKQDDQGIYWGLFATSESNWFTQLSHVWMHDDELNKPPQNDFLRLFWLCTFIDWMDSCNHIFGKWKFKHEHTKGQCQKASQISTRIKHRQKLKQNGQHEAKWIYPIEREPSKLKNTTLTKQIWIN